MRCPVCGTENATCTPPGYISPFEEDDVKAKTALADKATVPSPNKSRASMANKAASKRADKALPKVANK